MQSIDMIERVECGPSRAFRLEPTLRATKSQASASGAVAQCSFVTLSLAIMSQDWILVALPGYNEELRYIWASRSARLPALLQLQRSEEMLTALSCSTLTRRRSASSSVWVALVHPIDPIVGAALPPLEGCAVVLSRNVSTHAVRTTAQPRQ